MNSCIYKCSVMHHRLVPKKNKFSYDVFMFYIDLDEIDLLAKKHQLFGWNRFNLFSFYNKDHANAVDSKIDRISSVKLKMTEYIRSKGIHTVPHRITLLSNLTTMGYLFNPVSFYYLFDKEDQPFCAIAEVSNTFGEMKLYLLDSACKTGDTFSTMVPKNFYVSPFSKTDAWFHFILKVPEDKILQRVDDYTDAKGERFLLSSISGKKEEFSDVNLLKRFLSIPFITLKVIILIHWQAFLIYLKKIPYYKKNQDLQFQQQYIKL
ncbi:MAG TPA: DUF1365 domain-containing protein [Cytophagaceae bacterium]|jgi:DUF1365 family protein|nr:DUF1365 domain-containing protein [Cytophagaceae bacterium]